MAQLERIGWIPVYLVPDSSVLTSKLALVRQLVAAQRFVMVVPQMVVQQLDRKKKESGAVREAIRWLEACFQQGSKYIRAQKPQENRPLSESPLPAVPKEDPDSR